MGSVRARRIDADQPLAALPHRAPAPVPDPGRAPLAPRAGAAAHLDLGSRIALAANLQASAGNAATAQLIAHARTDHNGAAPDGLQALIAESGPGNRGLTRSSYTANPPLFRFRRTEQVGSTWHVQPGSVRLPALDFEVWWPATGRHRLGPYGRGTRWLEVTQDWANRLLAGENEHVADTQAAWDMTWGRVASVINAMAAGDDFTGATVDAAKAAAWAEFKRRLPAGLRPDGDTASTEAQEAKWGQDPDTTVFRRMMRETKRARDNSGWHTPDESMDHMEGENRIDTMATGTSRIPGTPTDRLMLDAWTRITGGP